MIKLIYHIAVFAITGGLIAITFKWCDLNGWDNSLMSMGFYRSVIIGLIYLAYAWPRREALLPKGKAKTYLIVSSQLKTISNALLIYILSMLDVSLAMVMYACIFPMFSLVMTRLANPVKDKLTKGRIAGCILGGIAAGLMAFKGDPSLSTFLFIIIM